MRMSLGHAALDRCDVIGDHANLSSTQFDVPCIFSDSMNILTMPTHDLRGTRDKKVKTHPPQPIGLPVLLLTCASAGCCF